MWNQAFLCSSESILMKSLIASFLLLRHVSPSKLGLFVNSSSIVKKRRRFPKSIRLVYESLVKKK